MGKALVWVFICSFLLLSFPTEANAEWDQNDLLVTADWLNENLDSVLVLDVRSSSDYETSHINGSRNVDSNTYVGTVNGITNSIFEPSILSSTFGNLGVTSSTTVVIVGPIGLPATRIFVAFKAVNHQNVKILYGGVDAWVSAGYSLTSAQTMPNIEEYNTNSTVWENIVATSWLSSNYQSSSIQILDARSSNDYSNSHIPGAIWFQWSDALNDNLHWRDQADLNKMIDIRNLNKTIKTIVYCASGNRASHLYFTLLLGGFSDVWLYDDSFNSWSTLGYNVETGDPPDYNINDDASESSFSIWMPLIALSCLTTFVYYRRR